MKHMKWISTLLLLFVPLIATAQLSADGKIAAQVPFKFTVGSRTVPAGEVTLKLADQKGWILTLCNRDVNLSMYALAEPTEAKKVATASALTFRKYGNRYFLASAQIGGSRDIYVFRPSPLEHEMRAQNIAVSEEVLLALLR
jgi:hypothetical protein